MQIIPAFRRDRVIGVASLLLLFAFSIKPAGAASEEEIKVLANLPLSGMHVNQMFSQKVEGKYYLYLHRPEEDTYALVDVTKENKPTLVNASGLKGSTAEGTVGPSPIAITATQEGTGKVAAAELPAQTINLVDTTNPKAPKTVKTFKGVTAMYADTERKLVYLVNGDGLWVVYHKHAIPICSGTDCTAGFHP